MDDSELNDESKESIGFDEKSVSYFVEGCENEIWNRYMADAVKSSFDKKMAAHSARMPRQTF